MVRQLEEPERTCIGWWSCFAEGLPLRKPCVAGAGQHANRKLEISYSMHVLHCKKQSVGGEKGGF